MENNNLENKDECGKKIGVNVQGLEAENMTSPITTFELGSENLPVFDDDEVYLFNSR